MVFIYKIKNIIFVKKSKIKAKNVYIQQYITNLYFNQKNIINI